MTRSTFPDNPISDPPEVDESLRLVCTEIWGGNRQIACPVELPGLRGYLFSRPCQGGRGGDVHYLSVCGSGLIARFCLADVAGHGDEVSRVSQEIHALLRKYMNWMDQRRVLRVLNRRLTRMGLRALTTAVSVTYFPPLRKLSLSYAGHPPAWLYRGKTGQWEAVDLYPGGRPTRGALDLPLAVGDETRYSRRQTRVAVGDRLLVLTDGLLETPDPEGEIFGNERLGEVLNAHADATPRELSRVIRRALYDHSGNEALHHDDVTLLIMEFTSPPGALGVWHGLKTRLLRPRGNSADPAFGGPAVA